MADYTHSDVGVLGLGALHLLRTSPLDLSRQGGQTLKDYQSSPSVVSKSRGTGGVHGERGPGGGRQEET